MTLPRPLKADEAGVTRFLADYYQAFSTLNVDRILSYFHEPCLLIAPPGAFAAPTHDLLRSPITTIVDSLRDRNYARSEFAAQSVKVLSATSAVVTGVAIRYKRDEQELERVGITYVLYRSETGWKIAVLISHDPQDPTRS